ncbi:type VII secretion integral membrane protein EccD [Mycolicibacillus trivialis]|uniref:EccD-like transmembrane domain-containing protein n=2 Tax=Mycolicibacillus trivialis TaxID=1798 RepID=A0A1X2EHE3_9MYCO|nr:type VII secretion integral membrane protein EccD [Mycolicibacillus trivialis]ORX02120.1 hypothetical protein AWC30_12990 [Mycolicibacillus trivialis]
MHQNEPAVRRVAVRGEGVTVDVTVPAVVAVAEWLPSLVELTGIPQPVGGYRLTRAAGAELDLSMPLSQQRVHDGALLLLSRCPVPEPVIRTHDPAEAVCAQHRPWSASATRSGAAVAAGALAGAGALLTVRTAGTAGAATAAAAAAAVSGTALAAATVLPRFGRAPLTTLACGLVSCGYAAVGGYLAVPEGPGPGNVLLAAMAGTAVAASARTLTGCGAVVFPAVSWLGLLVAAAALAGLITGATPRVLGAIAAVVGVAVIAAAARVATTVSGLAATDTGARQRVAASRAGAQLTALVTGAAVAGSLGAAAVAADSPCWLTAGFTALFGVLMVLRARDQSDPARTAVLLGCGVATLVVAFTAAALLAADPVWACLGSAVLVGAAMIAGADLSAGAHWPGIRRCADLVDYLAAAALVPLAVWLTGCYPMVADLVAAR